MKNVISKIGTLAMLLFFAIAVNAQMLNSNKMTEVNLKYVQFPTEGKIMKDAYVQFTDTQTGAAAMLNRAFQQKMGMAGGANVSKTHLSSPIFYSQGDIAVVVSAREPKMKEIASFKGSQAHVVYGEELAFSASATALYAETSFKVYQGDQLIYEHGPVKLAGYKQAAASSSFQGPAGGDLTSLKAMEATHDIADHFPHEEMALEYVEKILKARYGMGMARVAVTPYYVSGLKRDNKKQATELSERFVVLINQFQKAMGDADYNKELNDAIVFYKGLEAQYSDDKKAEINKKNIWQIQSNIAIAYFLMEQPMQAKAYMQKALNNRDKTIVKKESASGNAGFSAGMAQNYLRFAPAFIIACDNYKKGLDNNPSAFVAQFKGSQARKQINDKAQELLTGYQIAATYGIKMPVNIYDCGGDIKKVSGSLSVEGQDFNYQYNKVWYSFLQKILKKDIMYITKVTAAADPKDKVKFKDVVYYSDWSNDNYTIRPYVNRESEFKMAKSYRLGARAASMLMPTREYEDFITKKKVNAISRSLEALSFPQNLIFKSEDKVQVNVKYNMNNDIILAIYHERDMPGFEKGNIALAKEEVLFYDEIVNVFQFENGELDNISTSVYSVARDRDAKLPLDAKAWKAAHVDQLLPTTVVDEVSHKLDVVVSGDEVKMQKDGKTKNLKKELKKDGDNWISVNIGDCKVTRTIL